MKFKNKLFLTIFTIIVLIAGSNYLPTTALLAANNSELQVDGTTSTTVEDTSNLQLNCESCVLMEKTTRRFAYEKNSDVKMYPASTTKVLTAILTVENCKMDDIVTITKDMVSPVPDGYTSAYLKPGEKVTVEQLLNALLIPSANDAGFALAIHISGSTENFANLMNAKATEIGCTNSHFTNPSGIHNENHYSTAKDMALIGMYATSYPQIMNIVCKTSYTLEPINSNSRKFKTTNTLINSEESDYYEYATGMKTGFTDFAGSCIIATAKKDNMEFLVVILNAPKSTNSVHYRDIDCKTLFEYGFENYAEITKVDTSIINIIKNSIITDTTDIKGYKYLAILFVALLFIAMLKKSGHKRKKKKKNKKGQRI